MRIDDFIKSRINIVVECSNSLQEIANETCKVLYYNIVTALMHFNHVINAFCTANNCCFYIVHLFFARLQQQLHPLFTFAGLSAVSIVKESPPTSVTYPNTYPSIGSGAHTLSFFSAFMTQLLSCMQEHPTLEPILLRTRDLYRN